MTFLLVTVFIFSGAAGLIYESIWSRYLGLFVGHSAYAQVIVLVIYLGGMSVGAAIAARRSSRINDPLLAYAIVEGIVGLIGLFFHDLFVAVSGFAYSSIFPALAGGPALVIVKWSLAGILILPQAVLLGSTFPLMSAGLMRRRSADGRSDTGRLISILYFANSIGAAVGVLVAGFYLIGRAGLPGTLLTAAAINLLVAGTVYGAVRLVKDNDPAESTDTPHETVETVPPAPDLSMLWRVLLIVAAGTALSSFVYEIAWIRMLSLVLGSATHSFELMLSAFIFGLSLGAFWVRTRADTFRNPMRALGVTQWAMGALAILTLSAYLVSFDWMAFLIQGLDQNEQGYRIFTVAKYGIALAVMLPATFCAGITLPLITRMLLNAGSGERAVGAVYSVNTLGSIVGAGLAALVLMPLLGLKLLLISGGVIDMGIGAWLLFIAGRTSIETKKFAVGLTAATVLVTIMAMLNVNFDRGVLSSGVFRYGRVPAIGSRSVVFYKDGRTATVSVRKAEDGGYSLATNGKPDASLSPTWFEAITDTTPLRDLDGDESTQILLPLITLAHMPGAKQGAVIGNGSGMSSHLLLGSPALEKLVTIDIEPEMINGSHTFYPVNRRVFDDPRAQYVHDDAKSYFAASNRKFDLILSEPSNPWVSGVSGLFTDEFYQRIRTYLTPHGVFGQWLHLYEIDDDLVLGVIKALHKNFPSYEIFLTAESDVLIVASNNASLPVPDWSVFTLPMIKQDLAHFRPISPEALESIRILSRTVLDPLASEKFGVNSDFYPTLDLLTERSRYMKVVAKGFYELGESRYDVAAALLGRRILPTQEKNSSVDISRVNNQALGARLRSTEVPDQNVADNYDKEFRAATERARSLRDEIAANRAPADWPLFIKLAMSVENDRHAGTMGWTDDPWYASLTHFLEQQRAPKEAQSAVRFMHAIASYDWKRAVPEIEVLLKAREDGIAWINEDLFREGSTIAYMHTGDYPKARTMFDRLEAFVDRKPGDLRVRLLDAHITAGKK